MVKKRTTSGIFDGDHHEPSDESIILTAHTVEQLAHGQDIDEIYELLLKHEDICIIFPAFSVGGMCHFERWDRPNGFIAMALCPACHSQTKIKYSFDEVADVFFARESAEDTFTCPMEDCGAKFVVRIEASSMVGNSVFDIMAKYLIQQELGGAYKFLFNKDENYTAALLEIVRTHTKLNQAIQALLCCTESIVSFAEQHGAPYGHMAEGQLGPPYSPELDAEILSSIRKYRQVVDWVENEQHERLKDIERGERWATAKKGIEGATNV